MTIERTVHRANVMAHNMCCEAVRTVHRPLFNFRRFYFLFVKMLGIFIKKKESKKKTCQRHESCSNEDQKRYGKGGKGKRVQGDSSPCTKQFMLQLTFHVFVYVVRPQPSMQGVLWCGLRTSTYLPIYLFAYWLRLKDKNKIVVLFDNHPLGDVFPGAPETFKK